MSEIDRHRFAVTRDLLLNTCDLFWFHLDNEGSLLGSNCPDGYYFSLLEHNGGKITILEHLLNTASPVIVHDRLGLSWMAVSRIQEGVPTAHHLLGPFFSIQPSASDLRRICLSQRETPEYTEALLRRINEIPQFSSGQALRCCTMLYYGVTGRGIGMSEITILGESDFLHLSEHWSDSTYHGTWEAEQRLFFDIRAGRFPSVMETIDYSHVGKMAPADPLRQAKNETIVFTALCTRATIEGGVPQETAYNLSDQFIRQIESCATVPEVRECSGEVLRAFIRRVQENKRRTVYSDPVAFCLDYIEAHVYEQILLADIAEQAGYSPYYLSGKVREELGESVGSLIKRRKIEAAKRMLRYSDQDASEISEQLAFSSHSFFSATFRKYAGMTPSEYRQVCKKERPGSP